jgi:hypothetical protein
MTNISNMFLQMCLVSPPEVDVCSEEKTAVFLSPFFLPTNPETQTIKLKVRQTSRLEGIDKKLNPRGRLYTYGCINLLKLYFSSELHIYLSENSSPKYESASC